MTKLETQKDRFLLLYETARKSLLISQMLVERIVKDLAELESVIGAKIEVGSRVMSPLASAAAFVDFSHRFSTVVDAMPLINKKAAPIRALRDALAVVEDARNHLQHMRGDLSGSESVDYPLLGALSWANGKDSYTIFASQPQQTTVGSLVYDTQQSKWVSTYQYSVKHTTIDLPVVLAAMRRAFEFVREEADFLSATQRELEWGGTLALGFRVDL